MNSVVESGRRSLVIPVDLLVASVRSELAHRGRVAVRVEVEFWTAVLSAERAAWRTEDENEHGEEEEHVSQQQANKPRSESALRVRIQQDAGEEADLKQVQARNCSSRA